MTRKKQRRRIGGRGFWLLMGWGLAATIVVGLYLRWTHTSSSFLIGVISLTPLLFIPVVGLVVSAWRAWDRKLTLVAVGLAAAYIATFVSVDSIIGCGAETSDDAIVVYTHNVWWRNGDPAAVAGSIVASKADVIVLEEVWGEFLAQLEVNPALADHRYRASEPAEGTTGLAVWSRFPISDAAVERVGGVPILRTRIDAPSGTFSLDAVHTTAPVAGGAVSSWEAELAALGTYETATPRIMAGDFNATMDHSQFRTLVGKGWTDAHEPKGCGFDATWPTSRRAPTLLRLDHVLVTSHFEVLAVDIGDGAGSDHRSVTATLRLINPAAAPG